MNEPVVMVKDLKKVYDDGTEALKTVSFETYKNEIFGIIGVNGAGKTTLIRILTTMLRQTSGECSIYGLSPVNQPEKVRSIIGVLPQESGLYNEFSIYENLDFIGRMQGLSKSIRSAKIDELTKLLEIQDRLNTKVENLSGGLKQRTMIARSLMGNPKILFLDEPTTGLDVLVARRVRKIIKELGQNLTIFLATHNMFEAYQLCDRVAIIKDGEILVIDTPLSIYEKNKTGSEDFEDVIARLLGIDDQSITAMEEVDA
jgi:ABC-type multidrug transport system ATPase subunit